MSDHPPSTMNALFLTSSDKASHNNRPYKLLAGPVPVPNAPQNHLLIRVKAAAVDARDVAICRAWRSLPTRPAQTSPPPPPVPGCALSGVVVTAPPHHPFQPGQHVAALTRFGGAFAPYATVHADECWLTRLPFADAAVTAGAASVAFQAVRVAALKGNDTVAIAGTLTAAGALIARTCRLVYGVNVIAGVHGPHQQAVAQSYANCVVDRSRNKVTAQLGHAVVDVAFDVEGRLEQLCKLVKKGGTVVRVIAATETIKQSQAQRVRAICSARRVNLIRVEGRLDARAVQSTKNLLQTLQICAPSGPAFGIKQWGPALTAAEQGVDVGAVVLLH
ncbi:2-methylene-furan-3-one reductase [Gracilariopsis chorda]|uniref:2-methylene-furan-3-one reductase n=1 Tax=Gracilariopsis chorda TaxID=448386 RepID=A0A2V3IZU1_9FLOR|nr:2-methylene-furan-3-one reductase [Gracilariopsis chorda]|eukprot:PXF47664.1 2-methylene-furan-3-one reductase [Gracilariopsis chorda]